MRHNFEFLLATKDDCVKPKLILNARPAAQVSPKAILFATNVAKSLRKTKTDFIPKICQIDTLSN